MKQKVFNYEERKAAIDLERRCPHLNVPHNEPLWNDFAAYFKELFTCYPDETHRLYTADDLQYDINARYKASHSIDDVRRMLDTSYDHPEGNFYIIYAKDFIKSKI